LQAVKSQALEVKMDSWNHSKRVPVEPRQRRGEAFWRSAIERQRASGLVQQEFCDQEGLALSTFARWSQRLSQRSAIEQLQGDAQFVQLTGPCVSQVEAADEQVAAMHIRLNLGGGLSIEIVRN